MMRKAYKDRMLPEAFKKQMEKKKAQKKGQKREDPKGNPAGYYDGDKKKKADMGRKGPYADGMGKKCTCDSVAEELRGLLINDDEERADKPCGNSYIPQNAKCSKGAGQAKKPEAVQGKPQLSDKQKEKAIRKAAKGRLRNTSRKTIQQALERNKDNKSVEGRAMQKAAKRELFNRNVRNVAAAGLYATALGALYKNDPSVGGMMARDKKRKRMGLERAFRKPSARRR